MNSKTHKVATMQISPAGLINGDLPFTPQKATNDAIGYDVKPRLIEQVSPNEVHCYIGWKINPPKGFKITLVPQSRITKTNWIMQNSPGQGDPDFRGEYQIRFRALPTGISLKQAVLNIFRNKANRKNPFTYDPFPFTTNDTCGQIFIEKIFNTELHIVPEKLLGTTERGEGGFGSTKNKFNNQSN